jgi:exo-beta-1,3-glucanase (GH17 family)
MSTLLDLPLTVSLLPCRPDTDESYEADKSAILKYAPTYKDQVYAVTVGSESLYRGNFTGDQVRTIPLASSARVNMVEDKTDFCLLSRSSWPRSRT